jgi:hypothetical protein
MKFMFNGWWLVVKADVDLEKQKWGKQKAEMAGWKILSGKSDAGPVP